MTANYLPMTKKDYVLTCSSSTIDNPPEQNSFLWSCCGNCGNIHDYKDFNEHRSYIKRLANKPDYDPEIYLNTVNSLDWSSQYQSRGGIIVYTIYKDQLMFGLGRDTKTHDLTDFGGGCEVNDIDSVTTALREFKEESLDAFGYISKQDISRMPVMYTEEMLIILLYLRFDMLSLMTHFDELLETTNDGLEVDQIVWLTKDQLFGLVMTDNISSKLYEKVKNFLLKVMTKYGDFTTHDYMNS